MKKLINYSIIQILLYASNPSVICLGLKNIRVSSFLAKKKDFEKVVNKYACIIVELEEL